MVFNTMLHIGLNPGTHTHTHTHGRVRLTTVFTCYYFFFIPVRLWYFIIYLVQGEGASIFG